MIYALGINHKTAPVAVREKLAFAPGEVPGVLSQLQQIAHADELALVSTCNRTEFYTLCPKPEMLMQGWLKERGLASDVQTHLYRYADTQAVNHLMRVASGLDSMVVGEPQILSQLKAAYEMAQNQGSLGRHLQRLFQKTFMVAKMVRTQTAVSQFPVSIAYSAVKLAKQIFTDIKKARVLLIGAGETIELVSTHLKSIGVVNQTFANRTFERAQQLALDRQGQALDLDEMRSTLGDFDIVFSAVGTSKPILTKEVVDRALKKRKRHPVFMVDLGVPRNIEHSVGGHEDIYLYDLDDLRKVVDDNLGLRQHEALLAESIIAQHAQLFMRWLDADCAHNVIRDARAQAEKIKHVAVQKAQAQLRAGKDPQRVVEYLAHQLTQKLLHSPSLRVKKAGEAQEESMIKAASELLHFE